MSNSKKFKEKFVQFMSGNGFYAVLAVCLIGAGAAAWTAVDRTIDSIDENNRKIEEQNKSSSHAEPPSWDFAETEEARKNKEDIKVKEDSSSEEPHEKTDKKPEKKEKKSEIPPEKSKHNDSGKSLRPAKLTFVMPVEGNIIAAFSNGKLVKDPTLNEWKTHNGVDIKAPVGTKVVSVTDGRIEKIHKDKLWGSVIEVSHSDGTTSFYCGAEPAGNAKEGNEVKAGQQIGVTVSIPCELMTEPHLHLGIMKENNWINPLKHMGMER